MARSIGSRALLFGPVEYTRENRSGGHIESLIGIATGNHVLLSTVMSGCLTDGDALAEMALPVTAASLALHVSADRDLLYLTRAGDCAWPPKEISQLRAAGVDVQMTMFAPLEHFETERPMRLWAFTRQGVKADNAGALLDAWSWRAEDGVFPGGEGGWINHQIREALPDWLAKAEAQHRTAINPLTP